MIAEYVLIEKEPGVLNVLKIGARRAQTLEVDILIVLAENKQIDLSNLITLRTINNIIDVKARFNTFLENHSEWDIHNEYSNIFWEECQTIICDIWIISNVHLGHKFKSFKAFCLLK